MTPSQHGLLMCSQQDQLKMGFLGVFWQDFLIQNTPPQLEVVAFSKELTEPGCVSWFSQALAQGPILHPHNHEAQDRVCEPLPTDLRTCRLQLYTQCGWWGLYGGFLQGSHCHCSDSVVCAQSFRDATGIGDYSIITIIMSMV